MTRVDRLYCRNERAIVHARLDESGRPIALVPVAAILVAGLHFHFLPVPLDAGYRGPRRLACRASFKKGDEMGYFRHGSTIIVLGTDDLEAVRTGEVKRSIDAEAAQGVSAASVLATAFFGLGASLEERLAALRAYDRATVFLEIHAFFRPDNAVLVVAGDLDLAATMAVARARLTSTLRGSPFDPRRTWACSSTSICQERPRRWCDPSRGSWRRPLRRTSQTWPLPGRKAT